MGIGDKLKAKLHLGDNTGEPVASQLDADATNGKANGSLSTAATSKQQKSSRSVGGNSTAGSTVPTPSTQASDTKKPIAPGAQLNDSLGSPSTENWEKARELTKAAQVKEQEAQRKADVARNALLQIEGHRKSSNEALAREKQLVEEAQAKLQGVGDIAAAEAELESHKQAVQEKAAAAADTARRAEETRAALAAQEEEARKLQPAADSAQQEHNRLEREIHEVHRKRSEVETHHQETVTRLDGIRRAHEEKTRALAALDSEADHLAALISEYEMKLREARARYHDVDGRLGLLRREHAESQRQVSAFAGQPDVIAETLHKHRQMEEEYHSRVERTRLILANAQKQVNDKQIDLEASRKAAEAAGADASLSAREHQEAGSRLTDLEARVADLRRKQQAAQAEHNRLTKLAEEQHLQGTALAEQAAAAAKEYLGLKADAEQAHLSAQEYWTKAKAIGNHEQSKAATLLNTLEEKILGIGGN